MMGGALNEGACFRFDSPGYFIADFVREKDFVSRLSIQVSMDDVGREEEGPT